MQLGGPSTARHGGVDVAVIGAGPYGLSLAAHLAASDVRFRVFGVPMESWRTNMPEGMFMKSLGAASSLSAPGGNHTLRRFCELAGLPYEDWAMQFPLALFVRYGLWFQAALVANLEAQRLVSCSRLNDGFRLQLEDGEVFCARKVVVCTGFGDGAYLPPELAGAGDRVSHTSKHSSFAAFRDKEVLVIGAGQSALESAALLREAGARPTLIARRDSIVWPIESAAWEIRDAERSVYERLRFPRTPLGIGWRYAFFSHPVRPFFYLPPKVRKHLLKTVLGPFGAAWLKDRVVGRLPILTGWRSSGVEVHPAGVTVRIRKGDETREMRVDHVLAGTGYRFHPETLPFLAPELRRALSLEHGSPALSRNFESSVPGLFFAGVAAAQSFGPVMRFVAGAHVTSPLLASHLAGARAARAPQPAPAIMATAPQAYKVEASG